MSVLSKLYCFFIIKGLSSPWNTVGKELFLQSGNDYQNAQLLWKHPTRSKIQYQREIYCCNEISFFEVEASEYVLKEDGQLHQVNRLAGENTVSRLFSINQTTTFFSFQTFCFVLDWCCCLAYGINNTRISWGTGGKLSFVRSLYRLWLSTQSQSYHPVNNRMLSYR